MRATNFYARQARKCWLWRRWR